ncbi:ligand-gated channel [Acidobacteria bacterium Mor1]|nr:ligand-gated channel [Acidobacteria bacterium Mor1]
MALTLGWARAEEDTSSEESADESTRSSSVKEEVTVVGTRPAYRGEFDDRETPQAEQTIDQEVLTNAGALDLNQALDLSASVARQNNFGGLWNSFAVRGFVGDENLPSNFLVNGFNAGRGFGGPRDLSGIESVEVLKGPRAALYGRGEPGGTINLVTKRAYLGASRNEISLGAGRFDTYRADFDFNVPTSDTFAFRFVGFYEDAESFRDTIETQRQGATPSFLWRPSDRTQLVYEIEYSEQELPFDRGVLAVNGQLGLIPESRFLGEPGDGPMQADVLGHQIEFQHDFNDNWGILAGVNFRDTSLEGFSTEAELSASRQQLFVDGETLTRQRRFRDYDSEYRVFRVELKGGFNTGSARHNLIVGVDSDRFENDQVFLRARAPSLASNPTLEQLQAINIFNPVYGQFPLPTPTPLTNRVEVQESVGLYIQDQIDLSDRVAARLGVRFDDYEQNLNNRASDTRSQQTEDEVSPQFGLVFDATDDVALYLAYGENFRPLSGADFDGNPFAPNRAESAEIGAKFALRGGKLSATASIFQGEQENILVGDPVNAFFNIAAGEAETQGLEFDMQGEVAPGLQLWFSYAYVDAELTTDGLDPNFALPIAAGDRLLNIPEQTASLQLAKRVDLAGRATRIGGNVLHVGERLGEVATDFELPEYTLVGLFANIDFENGISLRAEANNIFDEEYYTNSFSQLWIQPGMPFNFRLVGKYRY